MILGLDVVVVDYRTPADLLSFVGTLFGSLRHARFPFRFFVALVDPTPDDVAVGNVAMSLALETDIACHLVSFKENIGYARACNSMASMRTDREHDRRVLAFFNADVEVTITQLAECYEALMAREDVGVLGPRQKDHTGRLTHAGIFGSNTAPEHRGWHEQDRGQYTDIRDDVVTVSGAGYFIKRSVWEELRTCPLYKESAPDARGAFLPTPHYYEETWCSFHARAHGYRVAYWGPVTIIHNWHRASPVGGWAERQLPMSQAMFRDACDHHRIEHG